MTDNLDGRIFRSIGNSENGEVDLDTRFHYRQAGDLVTATYRGGSVVEGHLIAMVGPGGRLDMRYHHVNARGELMLGTCRSTPERLADGRLRLHEEWQWLSGDRSSGRSVVEEMPAGSDPTDGEPGSLANRRDVTALFLAFSRRKLLDEYWPRLRRCVESLTPEQVWWRPNEASNSVGNLLLHLDGNVRQWLIASFAGHDDARDRPAEFAERRLLPPGELLSRLEATVRQADGVLGRLTDKDLIEQRQIQGYTVTGLDAVYHVIEHFGMHAGQVYVIAKMLSGADLGFYPDLDRTGRHD